LKLLTWIILVPATVVVVAFAIANSADVTISLDPLPFEPALPLYLLALIFVFIGMLVGGLVASGRTRRWRREARQARREAMRLEGELRAARSSGSREIEVRAEPTSNAA
jgi:uncharacterized integral membrane protein